MLRRIDLRASLPASAELRSVMPRPDTDVESVLDRVRPIVDAVRERGVAAVLEFTESFDKVRPAAVRVPAEELRRAADRARPGGAGGTGGVDQPGAAGACRAAQRPT